MRWDPAEASGGVGALLDLWMRQGAVKWDPAAVGCHRWTLSCRVGQETGMDPRVEVGGKVGCTLSHKCLGCKVQIEKNLPKSGQNWHEKVIFQQQKCLWRAILSFHIQVSILREQNFAAVTAQPPPLKNCRWIHHCQGIED